MGSYDHVDQIMPLVPLPSPFPVSLVVWEIEHAKMLPIHSLTFVCCREVWQSKVIGCEFDRFLAVVRYAQFGQNVCYTPMVRAEGTEIPFPEKLIHRPFMDKSRFRVVALWRFEFASG